MIPLLVAALALIPLAFDTGRIDTPMERHREVYRLPCYPDTVEVIEQQIVGCDTTVTFNGIPGVTYKIVICVPEGVDLGD